MKPIRPYPHKQTAFDYILHSIVRYCWDCKSEKLLFGIFISTKKAQSLIQKWIIVKNIMCGFNNCTELEQLIGWADRKRFKGPANAYRRHLGKEHFELNLYKRDYPRIYRWSRAVYILGCLVSPPTSYRGGKRKTSTYRSRKRR